MHKKLDLFLLGILVFILGLCNFAQLFWIEKQIKASHTVEHATVNIKASECRRVSR